LIGFSINYIAQLSNQTGGQPVYYNMLYYSVTDSRTGALVP